MERIQVKKYSIWLERILFPAVLFLFPLLKINQGVDLTDTGYSLGNYQFFTQSQGVWTIATYLSNVTGHLFTKLPYGDTMLGMRFYTALFISLMALLAYRFFLTKMPAAVAFAGEIMAIGLCWCPTVILYNYMTYFFFLLGAILLFRGLAGSRPICLILAGICLGLNVSVRFPNILQAGLILAVWYYGFLKKKTVKEVLHETLLCIIGYVAALLTMFLLISLQYGLDAYGQMIMGIFGMSGSASDYTLTQMLLAIVDAYLHGLRWLFYMAFCILPGIPFLMLQKERFPRLRKVVYCVCILLLFVVLSRWGMYNFRYYQKEAALQWVAVFLLISMVILLWMMVTRQTDREWKLIAAISLLIVLITPLGSNNHIYPMMNNMFFLAPVILWMAYKFIRWGRIYVGNQNQVPLFPLKAMLTGIMLMVLVQSIGVGIFYVFLDGEMGEKRDSQVLGSVVLANMVTTGANAQTLEELTTFCIENTAEYQEKGLILYGNIPALSYYLQKPAAIFTTWPDLDTNSLEQVRADLESLTAGSREAQTTEAQAEWEKKKPLVIVTTPIAAYIAEDVKGMEWCGTDVEACRADEKLQVLQSYLTDNQYEEVFSNDSYVIYE